MRLRSNYLMWFICEKKKTFDVTLSRQEGSTMRPLANAQWDWLASIFHTGLFLSFGGLVCGDPISNCPLDRVLTYKTLIYLLNCNF